MEEQELLVTQPKSPPPILPVAIVLLGIAIAGYNAWSFAAEGAWIWMAVAGLAPPLAGIAEWARLRGRGPEARFVADRLIWVVLFAASIVSL